MSNLQEDRIKKYYDPDYFYQHGQNPGFKNLMQIMQENDYPGKPQNMRTLVRGQPLRWLPARDLDDFFTRDLAINTFPRCIPILLTAMAFFVRSLVHAKLFYPVGKYGYTRISQTPFYRQWGRMGVVGTGIYVAATGFLLYKTFVFSLSKFYKHVILQERDWIFEYRKASNLNNDYFFRDTPMSIQTEWPEGALELAQKKLVTPPKWFKVE